MTMGAPSISYRKNQSGFTLVELVAVIVLLGIIGVGVTGYIRTSMEAYREVTRRDEIAQVGRFVIERLSREVKAALPGSVRRSNNSTTECLEFVPVLGSSIYVDLPLTESSSTFDVVDFPRAGNANIARVAVYTINTADVYPQTAGNSFIAALTSGSSPPPIGAASAGVRTITLAAPNRFPQSSPVSRLYFVDQPVSFCLSGGSLTQHSNYGYVGTQPLGPGSGDVSLLAERISTAIGSAFDYETTVERPNGVVKLAFTFSALGSNSETVQFVHDILLVNAQ